MDSLTGLIRNNRISLGLLLVSCTLLYLFWNQNTSYDSIPSQSPSDGSVLGKQVFRQRLVAIGDLHGDIDNAKKVLRFSKLIDTSSNWIGSTDILVQTGDIVDRETYAWDIYRLFQSLRDQAAKEGGKVVSILGNHEIMNAIGDWRYVTKEDIDHVGGTKKRMEDMSENGWLGKEWLANYSTTALVPLSPYPSSPLLSFTHGSLRPSYPNLTPYPAAINALGHSLLSKALKPPMNPPFPPNPYKGLPKSATDEEAELYDSGGPYWWRGLAEMEDEGVVCKWAEEVKRKTGARRIIGGHTPNFEKMVDRCNASIIIIDTGISSAYGGVLSALEILYTIHELPNRNRDNDHHHHQDPFTTPSTQSTGSELKVGGKYWEREEITAMYESGRKAITIQESEIIL